jgi:hypothetical protein
VARISNNLEFTECSFLLNIVVTFVRLVCGSNPCCSAMSIQFSFSGRLLIGFLRAGASLITLVMLVSFPLTKNHDFEAHFRNAEVRRTVVRHTIVSPVEDSRTGQVVHRDLEPVTLIPVDPGRFKLETKFIVVSRQRPRRLLLRLKFGRLPASGPDPFI